MIFLREIVYHPVDSEEFPFNLSIVKNLKSLSFDSPVTFFVGENGSGKSTFLEAIGAGISLPTIGSHDITYDPTLKPAMALADNFRFTWNSKTQRGFFLRAEDFFGFTKRLNELHKSFDEDIARYEASLKGEALLRARGAILGQKNALVNKYGLDLDANSHGESFLKIFQSRLTGKGLYLMDEPEAPLSPQRQLALISLIRNMVKNENAQFIIATHSPLLMALPEASIYEFRDGIIETVTYEETEHFTITKQFLSNPASFLRHL